VPGDPAVTLAGGADADPERVAQIREQLHLNDSTIAQFFHWASGALKFRFGNSLLTGRSIGDSIGSRLPVTLTLILVASVLAILIAVPLGLGAGMNPGGVVDRFSRVLAAVGAAVPSFVLGSLLIVLFASHWQIFPSSGYVPFSTSPVEWAEHVFLPAATLALFLASALTRQLRGAVIDVVSSNYIRTLWANGTSRRRILLVHGLRNAAPPGLTIFGFQVGALIGGTVVVEQIFGIPGIGQYFFSAIVGRDLPVVQAVTIVFVLGQLAISLGIDLMYMALNPRVRRA
jgi:peptide/nickel transport system permease protein